MAGYRQVSSAEAHFVRIVESIELSIFYWRAGINHSTTFCMGDSPQKGQFTIAVGKQDILVGDHELSGHIANLTIHWIRRLSDRLRSEGYIADCLADTSAVSWKLGDTILAAIVIGRRPPNEAGETSPISLRQRPILFVSVYNNPYCAPAQELIKRATNAAHKRINAIEGRQARIGSRMWWPAHAALGAAALATCLYGRVLLGESVPR